MTTSCSTKSIGCRSSSIFTPALTKQIVNNGAHYNTYDLQLDHGVRDISTVNERSSRRSLRARRTTFTSTPSSPRR